MSDPPTGTVTFLFTDIEGSTMMWERNPSIMQKVLARHNKILRRAIQANGGYVFKTVGDGFCAAFGSATDALGAALKWQRTLLAEGCVIRARMTPATSANGATSPCTRRTA